MVNGTLRRGKINFSLHSSFIYFVVITFVICCIAVETKELKQNQTKYGELLLQTLEKDNFNYNTKLWIYFTDKGEEEHKIQQKLETLNDFHSKTIERRLKIRQEVTNLLELVNEEDLPINKEYIKEITNYKGVELQKTSRWMNSISIQLTENTPILSTLNSISKFEFVKKIEIVKKFHKNLPVENNNENLNLEERSKNVLEYGSTYSQLNQINVPALHNLGLNGSGIHILLLDSGFNLVHPCTKNIKIIDQYDFVNDDNDVSDQGSESSYKSDPELHGTATLSCLGGIDPGKYYGSAFGASFLLAKTEDVTQESQTEEDNFIAALEWGEKKGCQIISASLGYQDWYSFNDKDGSAEIDVQIDYAVKQGIIAVLASGNDEASGKGLTVPSDTKFAITVGAVDQNGQVTSFSSQGPTFDGRIKPDVAALGLTVYVANCKISPSYIQMSGTSFATPLVAGAVALLLQQNPHWTPIDMYEALITTASNKDTPNVQIGWGVIDSLAASSYSPPSSPPTENGVCNDYSNCHCNYPYYGAYCAQRKIPCVEYCEGGICEVEEGGEEICTCSSIWHLKLCLGICGTNLNCASCARFPITPCVWCDSNSYCISNQTLSACPSSPSSSCPSEVDLQPTRSFIFMAILILFVSLSLTAVATAFFFCVVRP